MRSKGASDPSGCPARSSHPSNIWIIPCMPGGLILSPHGRGHSNMGTAVRARSWLKSPRQFSGQSLASRTKGKQETPRGAVEGVECDVCATMFLIKPRSLLVNLLGSKHAINHVPTRSQYQTSSPLFMCCLTDNFVFTFYVLCQLSLKWDLLWFHRLDTHLVRIWIFAMFYFHFISGAVCAPISLKQTL